MRNIILIKYLISSLVIFNILFPLNAFGQVEFYAQTENKSIGKNENFEVQFVVKNAQKVEQIIPPSLNNFNIISGPSEQSGMTIINGVVNRTQSIGYVLQPKHTGKFSIGGAIAIADGKKFYSEPVTITVNNMIVQNNNLSNNLSSSLFPFSFDEPAPTALNEYDDYILKKGENVAEKIKKNVFVKLEVSKNTCFVGEPIIATYKFYSRLRTESNTIVKTPSFNGFSVNELGRNENYQLKNETINGKEFNVFLIRKVELYPLQAGKIELEPVEIQTKISFIKESKNKGKSIQEMFQGLGDGDENILEQTVNLKNKPLVLTIKPLPENNNPDFKGAVGTFNIEASFENPSVYQEDGGNLIVKISGSGNIQMVNPPKVNWPEGISAFEPKIKENLDKLSVPIDGSKIFEYPFTINKSGSYLFSPINFSYFDPKSNSYKTVSTNPLTLNVKKGIGPRPELKSPTNNFSKEKTNQRILIVIIMLLILAFVSLIFVRFKNKSKIEPVNFKERPLTAISNVSHNPLLNLEVLLNENNSERFYKTYKNDLLVYLSKKLDLPAHDLSRKNINEALDKKGVNNHTLLLLNMLLDEIDQHLYSRSAPSAEMKQSYQKGIEIIPIIEKQLFTGQ